MPTWIGSSNNAGSPILRIRIEGHSEEQGQEFDAIIDTGFTGFISMPAVSAFPLGLILEGTTSTTLADGSQSPKFVASGSAVVSGERQRGTILLNFGPSDVLVGMEFITSFRKTLFVYEQVVALFDNADVAEFIKSMVRAATAAAEAAKSPPPPSATHS